MQLQMLLKFSFAHFRPCPFRRFPPAEKTPFSEIFTIFAADPKQGMRLVAYISAVLALSFVWTTESHAQKSRRETSPVGAAAVWGNKTVNDENALRYIVENGDTIYIDNLQPSKVYSRLPRQKGREWRRYYRLVHNFSKAYPYALVARKLVQEADSTIAVDNLRRVKREKYINGIQQELFDVFEGQMRNMTVSQGALLMKLIDREVGKSSFNIIKDYKNGIAAGFWQGIARMFGTDLKKPYDPQGEDALTEELVQIWESGDFQAFYFAIFWKDPPVVPIPEKYL